MSASVRNAPLSPISLGGGEWLSSKPDDPTSPGPSPGSLPTGRGNLASPPLSSSSNTNAIMSMNGFPPGPRSASGAPSPPASVGRSSMGASGPGYARSDSARNSTRTEAAPLDETVLQDHYYALKLFLQGRDPNAGQPPNKARDKLLRLSSVQFYELSTDVYDELRRRQATARAPPNAPNGPPNFLLPEKTFHPKRNQARQRLSSLGPPRFRDLATDVFHELERRFPRFVGAEIPRGVSSMSMRGPPRTGTPSNGYGRPPRMRQPSDAGSIRGPPPFDAYGVPPSPGLPPGNFGQPMQRQLNQNNTIVPNKSTMVEEDDDADPYSLASNRESKRSAGSSETDKKLIEDYQSQVQELREKIDGMEDAMKKKEDELSTALSSSGDKEEWDRVRQDLESKLTEAQNLNDSMKQELDRMRDDHSNETRDLQNQMFAMQQSGDIGNADAKLQEENKSLRDALLEQRQVTDEVRVQAQQFMSEMRTLSQQSTATHEKQIELERSVEQLEGEVQQWKGMYTRAKTQLRSMKASSIGLTMSQGAGRLVSDGGFADDNGLIKDVHVTRFQMAIDDLVHKAHSDGPDTVVDAMKSVIGNVRRIARDIDDTHGPALSEAFTHQKPKLKAKVAGTANSLITASKNYAAGAGLSPVSLLDAAADNLTGAIVELARVAGIRPTPAEELDEEDNDGSATPVSAAFFSPPPSAGLPREGLTTNGVHGNGATNGVNGDYGALSSPNLPPPPPFNGLGGMRASADSSAYSPVSSPRQSNDPYGRNGYAQDGGVSDYYY